MQKPTIAAALTLGTRTREPPRHVAGPATSARQESHAIERVPDRYWTSENEPIGHSPLWTEGTKAQAHHRRSSTRAPDRR